MKKAIAQLSKAIEALAVDCVMLEPGDIPKLGDFLKSLEATGRSLSKIKDESLGTVLQGMKQYTESLIMGGTKDVTPLEQAISQIQEIIRDLSNGKKSRRDISPLLASLGCVTGNGVSDPGQVEKPKSVDPPKPAKRKRTKNRVKREETPLEIGEEDLEILADFIAESFESLGTIEVKVMDLEHDPTDFEAVNAIFRSFHTIKGVSGFLNLNKINVLAHISESLLDMARNGSITMGEETADLILSSVDTLKRMIENLRESLERGHPSEGAFDTQDLVAKIEDFISRAKEGESPPPDETQEENTWPSREQTEDIRGPRDQEAGVKTGGAAVNDSRRVTKDALGPSVDQKRSGRPIALQVKIDTVKLDNVVDMVGELAIAQSMLRQNHVIRTSKDRNLDRITNQLTQIISGLQRTTMSMRMIPIRNTFQKMLRLVRDLERKAGKEVQLVMAGEDTEIDRNMVEEIYEPVVHMIRNSIDHGLESPEERERAGKPRRGTISLKAYHKGGDIVIEIADDGKGLDKEKIISKAMSMGLAREGEKLSEAEVHNLIFHPGFSTAEKVTDISGRGVGMDVVKATIIERLRGRVDVHSLKGQGTTFFVRLPLTLAIMDGMVIEVAGERYIIPTLNIQESFRPEKKECHTLQGMQEVLSVRGNLIPLIRIDRLFGLNRNGAPGLSEKPPSERLVVVVESQGRKACLLIDELLGQEEVVIKSLGGWLRKVKGIAGGAIMGDGRVGLILDIAAIYNMAFEG